MRQQDNTHVIFGPKRLYQIPDGAVITGVVKGIAVYLGLDPKVLRWIVFLLLVLTKGAIAIVYVMLMIAVPVAKTEEDYARAYGHALRRRARLTV